MIFRLSTFFHYIANVNINDEKKAIDLKNNFNEYAELGFSQPAEPRCQIRPRLGNNPESGQYELNTDFAITQNDLDSASVPNLNRRMTRFEDELLPPVDGKNIFSFISSYFSIRK